METSRNLAVLLSVPESFLLSGLECLATQYEQEIHPAFLIYGSQEFEALSAVELARKGKALEVFIYASNAAGDLPLNPEVWWKGIYMCVERLLDVDDIGEKRFIGLRRLWRVKSLQRYSGR